MLVLKKHINVLVNSMVNDFFNDHTCFSTSVDQFLTDKEKEEYTGKNEGNLHYTKLRLDTQNDIRVCFVGQFYQHFKLDLDDSYMFRCIENTILEYLNEC